MTIVDAPTTLQLTHLSGRIGTEIRGVDVRDLTDQQVAEIRGVWLERKVVFFPDQHITPTEHVAFAGRFGQPTEGHPVIPGLPGQPEVFEIDYSASARLAAQYGDIATQSERTQGLAWHTDVTFVTRPPLGSILRAVSIPDAGGDTLFSNQQAAYEALSPALQGFLETLTAVHDGRRQFAAALEHAGSGLWDGKTFDDLTPVEHPVVVTHPETGKKVLFVNPGFTTRIKQLRIGESDALLSFLHAHSVRDEFVVRYHWHEGTLGFWDNRATQHAVVGDWGSAHRLIQRVTLRGTEPRP
jgi:taurine dioxygenase